MDFSAKTIDHMRQTGRRMAHNEEWKWLGWPQLVLPLPPSANNLYPTRGRARIKSQEYLLWETTADNFYLYQSFQHAPQENPAVRWWLDMVVFMPNWSSGDLDNRNKAAIDYLCSRRGLQDKYLMRLREVRVTDGSKMRGLVLTYGVYD